jgi:hypothetical protein
MITELEQPVDSLYKDKIKIGRRIPRGNNPMMWVTEEDKEDFSYIRELTAQEQWLLYDRICALERSVFGE